MTQEPSEDGGIYGRFWDYYVTRAKTTMAADPNDTRAWPGDEWGSEAAWDARFRSLFQHAGVNNWDRAVEIGPGSGKYTLKVLETSAAIVRAYDVSKEFLAICVERCQNYVGSERLIPLLLGATDPQELLSDISGAGWKRRLDALYSIDVMVHIDLQYLIVYWLTAALTLKPGGYLVMTLNDVTGDEAFTKLMRDISWTFPVQGRPLGSGKFEWLSPDIVESLLPRLGFEITVLEHAGRDRHVVARLADPQKADGLAHYLGSVDAGPR